MKDGNMAVLHDVVHWPRTPEFNSSTDAGKNACAAAGRSSGFSLVSESKSLGVALTVSHLWKFVSERVFFAGVVVICSCYLARDEEHDGQR